MGALTSTAYRFRARPWDIEGAGTVCTLCPSQCNVELTIRDDAKVVRVLARDNEEVDDGWLCDKGRFGYQSFGAPERITTPLVRDRRRSCARRAGSARWRRRQPRSKRSGEDTVARVGGQATNEEGFLVQHLLRKGLGSPHVTPGRAAPPRRARARARARWTCPPGCRTSTTPTRSSCSTPSWSTRRRSSTCACARRCGATGLGSWWPRAARPRSTRPPTPPCASRRVPRRRRSWRWPPRSGPTGRRHALDELAARAGATAGVHPGGDRS